MRKYYLFLMFFCSIGIFAQEITVVAENFPPFSYEEDGNLIGFSKELFDIIIEEVEFLPKTEYKIYPWARAYRSLQNNEKIIILSITRTAERENVCKWIGPISSREIWLYKLASRNDIKLETIDDLRKYIIGSMSDSAVTHELVDR